MVLNLQTYAYRNSPLFAEVGTSSNRSANPQSNRQCCLFRGKTSWKKWTLLFSGLEVNVRELRPFFFLFGDQRLVDGKI